MWSIKRRRFQWPWRTPNPVFKVTGHAILWRWISHKRLKIRPYLLWKANRRPHRSFRMVTVWMTFSDLFKVMIIQRQITWKWYNTQLYLYNIRPIKSRIWSIERRHFHWPWTTPTSSFKVTPFFDAEYLRNGTTYRHSVIEILIVSEWPLNRILRSRYYSASNNSLYALYATVSFRMTLSDLEWLSKIFNDGKHRAVSLR